MEQHNAVITSTALTIDDNGYLSAWLYIDYGSKCQGFNGDDGIFIRRCLEIAGVDSWEKLPGCNIRVRTTYVHITAIGHIMEDDWLTPPPKDCGVLDVDPFNDD